MTSTRGSIPTWTCCSKTLPSRVSRQVRRGVIWMPFHFPESRTNYLTTDAGDKVTGTGEYKVCAARIEPVTDSQPEKVFPGAYAAV